MQRPRSIALHAKIFLLTAFVAASLTPSIAHEGHHVECNDTGINAMQAIEE
jgi:hypothetical protein